MSPSSPWRVCLASTSGHRELNTHLQNCCLMSQMTNGLFRLWGFPLLKRRKTISLGTERLGALECRASFEPDLWTLIMSDGGPGEPRVASVNTVSIGSPFSVAGNPLTRGRVGSFYLFFQPRFLIQKKNPHSLLISYSVCHVRLKKGNAGIPYREKMFLIPTPMQRSP